MWVSAKLMALKGTSSIWVEIVAKLMRVSADNGLEGS
jgi:hypothetical protein